MFTALLSLLTVAGTCAYIIRDVIDHLQYDQLFFHIILKYYQVFLLRVTYFD